MGGGLLWLYILLFIKIHGASTLQDIFTRCGQEKAQSGPTKDALKSRYSNIAPSTNIKLEQRN